MSDKTKLETNASYGKEGNSGLVTNGIVQKIEKSGSYGKGAKDRVDRKVMHTFVDDKTKISIRITQLPLVPWPQYSLLFGTTMEDGRFLPFTSIRRDSSLADANFDHDYEVIIGRMTTSALTMIRGLMREDIKAYTESRYDRDHQRALETFARGAKKAGTHNKPQVK
jgi:hypothetical protein